MRPAFLLSFHLLVPIASRFAHLLFFTTMINIINLFKLYLSSIVRAMQ